RRRHPKAFSCRPDRSACLDQRHRGIAERACSVPEEWLGGRRRRFCPPLDPLGVANRTSPSDLAGSTWVTFTLLFQMEGRARLDRTGRGPQATRTEAAAIARVPICRRQRNATTGYC